MHKKILLTLLMTLLPLQAYAEEGFPINYEPEVKPKNFGVNIFYLNSFGSDNKTDANEFRAEVKANFLNTTGSGIASEISFQHMPGTNPSILSFIVPPGDNAHTHDAYALIGYRFPFLERFGVTPFIKGRAIITRGRGGDNLYGPELGANLEWKIYPETASINLRYGLMIPVIHNYTGAPDTVGANNFLLSNLEARVSYRVLDNIEAHVGYQLRTFPKNLGNSNLATTDQMIWNSILFGLGFVF